MKRDSKTHAKWKYGILLGVATVFGLFSYIVYVSKAHSYLSDDPATCVNCHIMAPQFATWNHSSHREHATSNDCHVPQDNIFNKYYFKAKDGLRHATIFTMRAEPQVIQILEEGANAVQNNCIRCHENQHAKVDLPLIEKHDPHTQTDLRCWDCHREVPHGRVNSLTSTPNARVPLPGSAVPNWLKKELSDTSKN